jgi:alpha-tubulin suppressor-like RCC1 family protein
LGQLGNGATSERRAPIQVGSALLWAVVRSTTTNTCATQVNLDMYCWGDNSRGEIGDGTMTSRLRPQSVARRIGGIGAGDGQTCSVTVEGALYCWGFNAFGQVGDGSRITRLSPALVSSSGWESVSGGQDHTCATKVNGQLWCWGWNGQGQLGLGNRLATTRPARVSSPVVDWQSVASGYVSTCGTAESTIWCWGLNTYDQAEFQSETS